MEAIKLKELKNGEYFTLRPYAEPSAARVYVKNEYDRSSKKYEVAKFLDFCDTRLLKGDTIVYTGFTF